MRPSHFTRASYLLALLLPIAISARPRLNGYTNSFSTECARTKPQLNFDTTRFKIRTPIENWELPPNRIILALKLKVIYLFEHKLGGHQVVVEFVKSPSVATQTFTSIRIVNCIRFANKRIVFHMLIAAYLELAYRLPRS